jgi:putative ABC transport system permease protein
MHALLIDLRHGVRVLLRRPALTVVALVTLALGIGANAAVFSVVHALLLAPMPFPEPERLVFGISTFEETTTGLSAHDFFDYREQATSFESFAAHLQFQVSTASTGGDRPENVSTTYVSVNLFSTLGVAPELGRSFTEEEGRPAPVADPSRPQPLPPVALISHAYWQRRFGASPAVVGSTLMLRGQPVSVVGVMPAGFRFYVDADVWLPLQLNGERATARRFHNWFAVGRLRPGVTLAQAQAEVRAIAQRLEQLYPDSNSKMSLRLLGLHEALVQRLRPQVLLITAAVGLMLLIACGNIANLLLASGVTRRGEIAMRAALGASRGRLVRQLTTESVTLALLGGILGLAVAAALLRLLPDLLSFGNSRLSVTSLHIDRRVLLFAVALSLLTGVAVGLVPALRSTRVALFEELKGGSRTVTSRGGARLRMGLVALQVTLSLVLLVGSSLLVRSFVRLARVELGFDPQDVLTARLALPSTASSEEMTQFFSGVLEEVRAVPGVSEAALVSRLPVVQGGGSTEVWVPERPQERSFSRQALGRVVMPGYFAAMHMPLVAGRDVQETDRTGAPPVAVIGETMARTLFPDENPVGRRFVTDLGDSEPTLLEVVGVVADARLNQLDDEPGMVMYFPYHQVQVPSMYLAVRTATDPQGIVRALREIVWGRNGDIPVEELATLTGAIARTALPRKTLAGTVSTFSLLALLLAAVGLYGVLAYQVNQRRHEIGIRMALGAKSGHILRAVLGQGLAVTGAGLAIGIVAGFLLTRLMRGLLYEVGPADPVSFLAAAATLSAVALIACLVPGVRALRVQPTQALRYE